VHLNFHTKATILNVGCTCVHIHSLYYYVLGSTALVKIFHCCENSQNWTGVDFTTIQVKGTWAASLLLLMHMYAVNFCIRKLVRTWYNHHSDIPDDKAIFDMLVLVNLTISAKLGRITNSGIQLQFHIIEYLTASDRWVILGSRKNNFLLHRLILLNLSALMLFDSIYLKLLIFVLS
jgi:hypothetical protein